VDYGSAFKQGEKKMPETESPGYTPKDNIWDSKSDIFSLGKK
jgi:hypothetical protein